MCVCPLIPSASHIGITKERYQRILRNTGIVLNFADFPKNFIVQKLWRNMPTSSSSGVLPLFSLDTGIVLNFADFPKNASFKSYGVICLPRAAPAS